MQQGSTGTTIDLSRIVSRAARVLTAAWNSPVQLGQAELLSEARRRNLLIRCAVVSGPASAAASVIVKQAAGRDYDPDNPKSHAALGLFRDWAALQFLNTIGCEPAVGPKIYGGDRAAGFFIMEDLSAAEDLDHVLTCGSAPRAEKSLLLLAQTLGRMHAATAGRLEQYQQIRDALGPGDRQRRAGLAEHVRAFAPKLAQWCRDLGVAVTARCTQDLESVALVMAEPGPFLAFTHADPCPDNSMLVADRLCLIDFEFASFRHALLDGVYGRLRFPTCHCVRDIPETIVAQMESAHRQELVKGCPAALDDAQYFRAVADASAYWVLENLAHLLPRALEYEQPIGLATNRQRLLKRLLAFDEVAKRSGHLEGLRETLRRLCETLSSRWRSRMSVYDAFLQRAEASPDQIRDLLAAVQSKQVERVGQLLNRQPALAQAKLADDDQTPVLFPAVESKDPQVVRMLLEKGADWRTTTRCGWTVLAKACSDSTPEVVELLLAGGADLNARDVWGSLPIYGAIGNPQMLEYLLSRGGRIDLKAAFDLKKWDVARELLHEEPARARFRFGTGMTLLHDLARGGAEEENFAAMRLLLAHGADVNARTDWDATPLHVAALNGQAAAVQFLLDHGAEVNPKDERGNTPYALAMEKRHTDCADVLLRRGGSL